MYELLWLLLPVAAASGWVLAKRDVRRAGKSIGALSPEYFKGLNYLLNEQPDKAIEVFVRMLEVDSDTVEIHLALGNLFRQRGEVDRAIRIHQNLIARPTLSKEQRAQALLELGQDYLRAGLFDRVESLSLELIAMDAHTVRALRLLSDIYQQEREWEKAITILRKLQSAGGEPQHAIIAHCYCELAEQARKKNNDDEAMRLLKRALAADGECVRASLLRGAMAAEAGDCKGAIRAYEQVEKQDPAYLSEMVPALVDCYRRSGKLDALSAYLERLLAAHGGVTPLLVLVEIIRERQGEEEAMSYLSEQLRTRPTLRGLAKLVSINAARAQAEDDSCRTLQLVSETFEHIISEKPLYRCNTCGFTGKTQHWLCPGCKHWNTVKPIQGVEGE